MEALKLLSTTIVLTLLIWIGADEWLTVTATFSPPEYVIVDQTDYLEFDLFAHVTINDGEDTTMQFRFDDNTIAIDDQMGVRNLGLHRE